MDVEVQAGNLEAVVECAAGDVGGCRTGMGGSGKCTAGDGMKQDSAAAAAQRCRGREDVETKAGQTDDVGSGGGDAFGSEL